MAVDSIPPDDVEYLCVFVARRLERSLARRNIIEEVLDL
jgi:hypothetical protein